MCGFISWIEKNDGLIYLTYTDIYDTKKGKDLQKFCINSDDLTGHGAIRHYYGIKGGTEKECTDFSTPDNFPAEIVKDIKAGKMRYGLPNKLEDMLNYKSISKLKRLHKREFAEWDKASAEWCKASAELDKASAELDKASAELDKAVLKDFWVLFSESKCRQKVWR